MPEWLKRLTKTDIRNTITLVIVFGCFASLFVLLFREIPEKNHDIVTSMISFITGSAFGAVVGYHFTANKTDKKQDIDHE